MLAGLQRLLQSRNGQHGGAVSQEKRWAGSSPSRGRRGPHKYRVGHPAERDCGKHYPARCFDRAYQSGSSVESVGGVGLG
jgi:hypothetical protein